MVNSNFDEQIINKAIVFGGNIWKAIKFVLFGSQNKCDST